MKKIWVMLLGISLSLCWAGSKTTNVKMKHTPKYNHKEHRVPAPIMDEELNPAKRPSQW